MTHADYILNRNGFILAKCEKHKIYARSTEMIYTPFENDSKIKKKYDKPNEAYIFLISKLFLPICSKVELCMSHPADSNQPCL